MAWRDDEARTALIRQAADSMTPGGTPASFTESLFGRTTLEDLATTTSTTFRIKESLRTALPIEV